MRVRKCRRSSLWLSALCLALAAVLITPVTALAAVPLPDLNVSVGQAESPQEVNTTLQILVILTLLTMAPAFLLMMTSFTRIIIVLSFIRSAMGIQQMPPNQVLVGIALFLSLFTMGPTLSQINTTALQPYLREEISQGAAVEQGQEPLRKFMLKQTREKDIALFVDLSKGERPKSPEELSMAVLIPAFMISELKTAFQIGFLIYIPFLVIDLVVASVLMSMGMMMLPPMLISLPFKILLFVMVDGWYLITRALVQSFG